MRDIFRVVLLVLAVLLVSVLGYVAYGLVSQTLTYPFSSSEKQIGSSMQIVVSPPRIAITGGGDLLDARALEKSLVRDGQPLDLSTVSGEYRIDFRSGGYAQVEITSAKETRPITLDADRYNKEKSTSYRLPRDITLTPTDIPYSLSYSRVSEPRERVYDLEMYGIPDADPSDIRYYVHYDTRADCSIMSWGRPMMRIEPTSEPSVSGESKKYGDVPLTVESPTLAWIYSEIQPEVVSPAAKNGQKWQARLRIPYDTDTRRVCVIAGVAGKYSIIEDRLAEPFTATGNLITAVSPLYDMKSQIEIDFSHDIYTDSGSLYSPEYLAHRRDAKIAFLKHLDIIPHMDITDEDLILTPDRAIITLPLRVSVDYELHLRDIEDIYGRKTSLQMPVRVESEPFLALHLTDKKQMYTLSDPIDAKLYGLKTPRKTYSLKLCSVSLENYARLERILTNQSRAKNSMVSEILANGRECRMRDVVIPTDGYTASFRIDDFFSNEKKPGLYVLGFTDPDPLGNASGATLSGVPKFLPPVIFSLVDTHIVSKVDASGRMTFLATDIATGKPRTGQTITVTRNISRTYTERWNPATQVTEKDYIPLASQGFATGVILGSTDPSGFLETRLDTLKGLDGYDSSPYSLSFESWWDYEGRYDTFLLESRGDGHLGYLVSTWNDGITGYNFGLKDSDYSWMNRGRYTSYIHPDRKLYLPGETVQLHAIIRENVSTLTIPRDTPFDVSITDPLGREVKRATYKTNDFGSIFLSYDIPKDGSLGMYGVSISIPESTDYIENSSTNFQVEVFKNPTFTASVELKSDDLVDGTIKTLRKVPNTDPYSPWYNEVYTGDMTIQGIIRAKYYNGAEMKNASFSYRVYRSVSYPEGYWGDCFWGCYFEPSLEPYTEGTGSIDSDGYGVIRVPVSFRSSYDDYTYTVEVTLRDELSGESVTTPGSITVKLPTAYKLFGLDNPLEFTPKKKILTLTDPLVGTLKPQYGPWDASLSGKYQYEIIRREYDEVWVEDIRTGKTRVTTSRDVSVQSGSITGPELSLKVTPPKPGEYHLRISPISANPPPESTISDEIFYINGGAMALKDSNLRVIPERTIYRVGETARVMIQVPFTGAYLLITKEKGGVIDREYTYLTGNTLIREYEVDDTFLPNAYIGVVALAPLAQKNLTKTYAVGYGEIITDIADKKSKLTVKSDKEVYKNRETANIDILLTDRGGNPLQGEVTVMVVDESLIRILGNIDLDIMAKFYQKFPFTVKTSLSMIGRERGQYLSRKGSSGGGGNKGGGGIEIASRTIFKNTAYYNPGVLTDASGKARVSFVLPDNVTDYRIIAIANTKDSRFAVAEKGLSIRKDYVIEPRLPMILYPGDTTTVTAQVFNSTKRITDAEIIFSLGTGSGKITKKSPLSLSVGEKKGAQFSVTIPREMKGTIPYTFELRDKSGSLDTIVSSLRIVEPPVLTDSIHDIRIWTGTTLSYTLPNSALTDLDPTRSRVEISLSSNYLPDFERGLDSLLSYPYGCIEQTIASTLPNRIALSVADAFGLQIDRSRAQTNTREGLAKILRMQHISGGWVYWEGGSDPDAHITPYVIRTLRKFRDLGEDIPSSVFENGANYIVANEGVYTADTSLLTEAAWTLALEKHPSALAWWSKIDPKTLGRHQYVGYISAASLLGKYTPEMESRMLELLSSDTTSDWYWGPETDRALFAQLLYARKEREKGLRQLIPLTKSVNVDGYYVSTQQKIQYMLALIAESQYTEKLTSPIQTALRGDALIADMTVGPKKSSSLVTTTREKTGKTLSLKRNTSTPLILITRIQDAPKEITKMPSYSTGGIAVTRVFESIDESKGVDRNGKFVSVRPVTGGVFERGKLYRVTLKATLSNTDNNAYWSHLAIEDFLPGAWRPIQRTFDTESSDIQNQQDDSWWSYTESRDDRVLAHLMYGWGSERSYTYYFRPEAAGDYLLPPATAYFMYDPDRHAYTSYSKVKVVD